MRRALLRFPLWIALLAAPVSASAVTLDAFTDAFPPNPCLPVTGAPVLFTGAYCDGASCPPDLPAACEHEYADQSGLAGVLSGARRLVMLEYGTDPLDLSARVRTELGRLEVATGGGGPHVTHLEYGSFAANLDLNLTAMGVTEITIPIDGEIGPGQPITCVVELYTQSGPGYYAGADMSVTLTVTGVQVFPLALFTTIPGYTPSDVDLIRVHVGECPVSYCDGPFVARDYALGPITLVTGGPTAARGPSWGRLKSVYR